MVKALLALATVTSIGVATAIENQLLPIDKVGGAEALRSVIDGVILGSNVWYCNPSLAPGYTNSWLIMRPSTAALDGVLDATNQED
jgi:hypothetical protein